MSVLLNNQEFNRLSLNEKEERLDKYLHNQHDMSRLNNNKELQNQFDLLLKLQPDLITRFGKFIVINTTDVEVVQCCDDIKSAMDVIYGFDSEKESFIYQLPTTV